MVRRLSLLVLLGSVLATVERGEAQELTRLFRIGESGDKPELTFAVVSDLSFGPDSTIYVLDALNGVVRVYDFSGSHVRSFGRKGEGPGEFSLPNRLLVTAEGVTLFDLGRAISFTHHGELAGTRILGDQSPNFTVAVPLRHGRWVGAKESIVIGPTVMRLSKESARFVQREGPDIRSSTAYIVGVVEDGSEQVDTIFSYDHGAIFFITPRGVGPLPRSAGRGGGWAVAGDSLVALVDGLQGSIRVLESTPSGLQQLWSLQAPIKPEELGQRDWRETTDRAFKEQGRAFQGHVVGPPYRPQLDQPVFSDDGRLWVRRIDAESGSESTETRYFILSPTEPQIALFTIPASIWIASIKNDLILAQGTTDLGVQVVELWQFRTPKR